MHLNFENVSTNLLMENNGSVTSFGVCNTAVCPSSPLEERLWAISSRSPKPWVLQLWRVVNSWLLLDVVAHLLVPSRLVTSSEHSLLLRKFHRIACAHVQVCGSELKTLWGMSANFQEPGKAFIGMVWASSHAGQILKGIGVTGDQIRELVFLTR